MPWIFVIIALAGAACLVVLAWVLIFKVWTLIITVLTRSLHGCAAGLFLIASAISSYSSDILPLLVAEP